MSERLRLGKWVGITDPGVAEAEQRILAKSPQAAYKYEDVLISGVWDFRRVGAEHYSVELSTVYDANRRVSATGTAISLDLLIPFAHEWELVEVTRTLTTGGIDQGLLQVYLYPLIAEGYLGVYRFARSFDGRVYGVKNYTLTLNAQSGDYITPSFIVRRLG